MRRMPPLFPGNSSRGVTLVELCFGMAIVALLAGLAAPGFRTTLRVAAVRAATYELLAGLQQTRGRSIVEARPGILCPSDAAGNCLPASAPSSFWRISTESTLGSVETDLHELPSGVVVRASRAPLRFWPNALAASTGTLTICDLQRIAPPRAIVLSLSGRARLSPAAVSACG
jgi:type IV fimbrial biogenesis protein FimT